MAANRNAHLAAYTLYLSSLTLDPSEEGHGNARFPVVGGFTGRTVTVKKKGQTYEEDEVVCNHAWPAPLRDNGAHGCATWLRKRECLRDDKSDGIYCNFYLPPNDSEFSDA